MAGRALGGLAGAAIDNALLGGSEDKVVEGPRLKEIDGLTSTEGAPIPRVYGRARIGGQLIWATRLSRRRTPRPSAPAARAARASAAAARRPGPRPIPISPISRSACAKARSRSFAASGPTAARSTSRRSPCASIAVTKRRAADPLIVAKEGAANAPAYRGLAYVVFERLPLADFGNRVPQFSFEVVRPVDGLNNMIRAVTLIPGASEFGYDTVGITQSLGLGTTRPENRHQLAAHDAM